MDATLAKLIQSRSKSVNAQIERVGALEKLRSSVSAPAAVVALDAQLLVARQRLAKLREELRGLELAAEPSVPEAPKARR